MALNRAVKSVGIGAAVFGVLYVASGLAVVGVGVAACLAVGEVVLNGKEDEEKRLADQIASLQAEIESLKLAPAKIELANDNDGDLVEYTKDFSIKMSAEEQQVIDQQAKEYSVYLDAMSEEEFDAYLDSRFSKFN